MRKRMDSYARIDVGSNQVLINVARIKGRRVKIFLL